jgi:hypothetical protein
MSLHSIDVDCCVRCPTCFSCVQGEAVKETLAQEVARARPQPVQTVDNTQVEPGAMSATATTLGVLAVAGSGGTGSGGGRAAPLNPMGPPPARAVAFALPPAVLPAVSAGTLGGAAPANPLAVAGSGGTGLGGGRAAPLNPMGPPPARAVAFALPPAALPAVSAGTLGGAAPASAFSEAFKLFAPISASGTQEGPQPLNPTGPPPAHATACERHEAVGRIRGRLQQGATQCGLPLEAELGGVMAEEDGAQAEDGSDAETGGPAEEVKGSGRTEYEAFRSAWVSSALMSNRLTSHSPDVFAVSVIDSGSGRPGSIKVIWAGDAAIQAGLRRPAFLANPASSAGAAPSARREVNNVSGTAPGDGHNAPGADGVAAGDPPGEAGQSVGRSMGGARYRGQGLLCSTNHAYASKANTVIAAVAKAMTEPNSTYQDRLLCQLEAALANPQGDLPSPAFIANLHARLVSAGVDVDQAVAQCRSFLCLMPDDSSREQLEAEIQHQIVSWHQSQQSQRRLDAVYESRPGSAARPAQLHRSAAARLAARRSTTVPSGGLGQYKEPLQGMADLLVSGGGGSRGKKRARCVPKEQQVHVASTQHSHNPDAQTGEQSIPPLAPSGVGVQQGSPVLELPPGVPPLAVRAAARSAAAAQQQPASQEAGLAIPEEEGQPALQTIAPCWTSATDPCSPSALALLCSPGAANPHDGSVDNALEAFHVGVVRWCVATAPDESVTCALLSHSCVRFWVDVEMWFLGECKVPHCNQIELLLCER